MKEKDLDLGRALKIVSDLGGRRKKESDAETLRAMLKGKDISEVVNLMICAGNTYNRRILRFFRWFCKWIPIAVMLTHWYGLYDFSQHPREMFVLDSENTSCYLWIYFMVYVLPMVIIAASHATFCAFLFAPSARYGRHLHPDGDHLGIYLVGVGIEAVHLDASTRTVEPFQ